MIKFVCGKNSHLHRLAVRPERGRMDSSWKGLLLRIGLVSIGIGILLPLVITLLSGRPAETIYSLIAATFLLEYGAAALGAGMGLGPGPVFLVVSIVALGVHIVLFGFLDTLGAESERARRFQEKTIVRADKNRIISKYGIYGLPPAVWTIGFYFCPGIVWVLGWNRWRAIILIMAGYLAAAAVTYYVADGALRLIGII